MRSLFFAGAKLLGLYFTYRALLSLVGMISLLVAPPDFQQLSRQVVFYSLISTTILLAVAYMLIFATNILADVVRLKDDSMMEGRLSAGTAVRSGTILIGIYVFVTHVGGLISAIQNQFLVSRMGADFTATHPPRLNLTRGIIDPALSTGLALFLIFGSESLTNLIMKGSRSGEKEEAGLDEGDI